MRSETAKKFPLADNPESRVGKKSGPFSAAEIGQAVEALQELTPKEAAKFQKEEELHGNLKVMAEDATRTEAEYGKKMFESAQVANIAEEREKLRLRSEEKEAEARYEAKKEKLPKAADNNK